MDTHSNYKVQSKNSIAFETNALRVQVRAKFVFNLSLILSQQMYLPFEGISSSTCKIL